jgi:hypothetical protein
VPQRITLTVNQIRRYFDEGEIPDDLDLALDNAQGDARTNNEVQSIIITVVPDKE